MGRHEDLTPKSAQVANTFSNMSMKNDKTVAEQTWDEYSHTKTEDIADESRVDIMCRIGNNIYNTNGTTEEILFSKGKSKHDVSVNISIETAERGYLQQTHKHMYVDIDSPEIGNPYTSDLKVTSAASPVKNKFVTCNCKKSRCLKLYCDCFRVEQYCNGCNCSECANLLIHEIDRQQAISVILERNPEAFKPRIMADPGLFSQKIQY